ncbi:hypothetical protein X756_23805 [Mesorhizobium sp. LSHC412B00]|nr:hypothetical protein X756_23805 [Mesorhizobium sp. LSHC412B00]
MVLPQASFLMRLRVMLFFVPCHQKKAAICFRFFLYQHR